MVTRVFQDILVNQDIAVTLVQVDIVDFPDIVGSQALVSQVTVVPPALLVTLEPQEIQVQMAQVVVLGVRVQMERVVVRVQV